MRYLPPKGTQDLWNEKFYVYDSIAKKILMVTEQYGFRQIRTPGFEPIEILAKDAGAEVTDQIYTFKDKGGRSLGIKSDITPAIARFIAGNSRSIPKPIKVTCYDRVYRYERPQSGRNREITQINAELFGAKTGLVEAELLACFYQCYVALGLPSVEIEIGFRPLLETFVRQLPVDSNQILPIMRLIDKKDKIGEEAFIQEVSTCGVTKEKLDKLQLFISLKGDLKQTLMKAKSVLSESSQLQTYLSQLNQIADCLQMYGVDKQFRLNLGLARGSDYYTGIIFEAKIPGSNFGSIGGGGRYDNLVAQYGGPDTPAIGFSIGIDRVCLVLEEQGVSNSIASPKINYYLATERDPLSMSTMTNCAQKLRERGLNVEIDVLNKNMSEQLQTAKELKAAMVILFKKKELLEKKIIVIDLATNVEEKLNSSGDELFKREVARTS